MVEKINNYFEKLHAEINSRKLECSQIPLAGNYFSHYVDTLKSSQEMLLRQYNNGIKEMQDTKDLYSDIPFLYEQNNNSIKHQFNVVVNIQETLINNWTKGKYIPKGINLKEISLNQFKYELEETKS